MSVVDSLCPHPFGACSPYEHRHCCRCSTVLEARGEGPVYSGDPPSIDGYENARICSDCGDDFFLLCKPCAQRDPRCPACASRTVPS